MTDTGSVIIATSMIVSSNLAGGGTVKSTLFFHPVKSTLLLDDGLSDMNDVLLRNGRADCWLKVKNPAAPAVTREAEGESNCVRVT